MIAGLIAWLAGSRFALAAAKWGAVALTVLLFLLSVRRAGERAGRIAERLQTMEKTHDVQRRMGERRKSDQKVSASEGMTVMPRTSRRPSVLTATATITAIETIRPPSRSFT